MNDSPPDHPYPEHVASILPLNPITIEPPPSDARWRPPLRRVPNTAADSPSSEIAAGIVSFRSELGLPIQGPVIMSGHQPGFWHAGILAKVFAVQAAAERTGAFPAWVVVDHDPESPMDLRFPTAAWEERTLAFATPNRLTPPSALPPWNGDPAASSSALIAEPIRRAVDSVVAAMRLNAAATDLSSQATRATADLLSAADLPDSSIRNAVTATRIATTSLVRAIVADWSHLAHARACIAAYNAAAERYPDAGIRPLASTASDVELPLWHLDNRTTRARVMWSDLARGTTQPLVPKALLMTMLLRLAGCELFVHGLGGGNYDRVMEAWVAAWKPDFLLAPSAVVSATVLLNVPGMPPPSTSNAAARAAWRAHAASHSPDLLNDAAASEAKQAGLREVAALKGNKLERRAAYRRMHTALTEYRSRHAAALAALARDADTASASSATDGPAADRTWPWMLHPRPALAALNQSIADAF